MTRKTVHIPGLQTYIDALGRSKVQRIVNKQMRFGRIKGFTKMQRRQWVIDALNTECGDHLVTLFLDQA